MYLNICKTLQKQMETIDCEFNIKQYVEFTLQSVSNWYIEKKGVSTSNGYLLNRK